MTQFIKLRDETFINISLIEAICFRRQEKTRIARTSDGEQQVPAGVELVAEIVMASGSKESATGNVAEQLRKIVG